MRLLTRLIFAGATISGAAHAEDIAWSKVDEAMGRPAAVTQDVHRYGFPRADLNVVLDGVAIKPSFALGGWVAFKPMGDQAMVMGDIVLLDSEIEPVMAKMAEGGLDITAIHNHLLRASPATFYMHVGGHGDPVQMAKAIHDALSISKTPMTAPPPPATPPAIDLDSAQIENIIGVKGQANGGVLQFNVPRRDAIAMGGMPMAPVGPMGVAETINFQPVGGGNAAITGDFVLIDTEVNPALKTLRANGIDVTALHSYMLTETPRLFFMHFWAKDDAIKLARGLRAALDKTASVTH
jgi:hypothetical protein